MPERERLASLAAHGATMVIFLSIGLIDKVQAALFAGRVYTGHPRRRGVQASWPEEKIVRCTVGSLAESTRAAGITKTALIVWRFSRHAVRAQQAVRPPPLPPSSAKENRYDPRLPCLYGNWPCACKASFRRLARQRLPGAGRMVFLLQNGQARSLCIRMR